MNDLMEWLANFAFDHSIGYILTHILDSETPSTSYGEQGLVIVRRITPKYHSALHIKQVTFLNSDEGINEYSADSISTKKNTTPIWWLFSY